MNLTLATWNLRASGGRSHADVPLPEPRCARIRELLAHAPIVLAVQELTPGYAKSLPNVRSSLAHRPPGRFDGGNRHLGVGILASSDVVLANVGVIGRAPFPDRTLVADVAVQGQSFHVVAFHSLTGVDYKKAKAAQFCAIAEYLADCQRDVVLLGDANEPEVDAPDSNDIRVFGGNGNGAELLFGPQAVHGLRDAWRVHLAESGAPVHGEGPLATSYRSGNSPRRYDHIYVPAYWRVPEMRYDYQGGLGAGSDHAIVVARVEA